jgi:hypothetical protein
MKPNTRTQHSRIHDRTHLLSKDAIAQGQTLYRQFTHAEPTRTIKVQHPRLIPPVVVDLGELVGIIYRSDKGQPGSPRAYVHLLQQPPRLVSNSEGTQLYIIGGKYHITSHGIEG